MVAAVVVGIAGNAGEHGGAVVLAARGDVELAGRVALGSAAQVAALLLPLLALTSLALGSRSALRLGPVELASLGAAVVVAALVVGPGRSSRCRLVLLAVYACIAAVFFTVGQA